MRNFFERHFGAVLLLSCLAGLVVPGLNRVPDGSAVITLALLTFVSCFKLRDNSIADIRWWRVALFYVLRYMLLPVLLWWLAQRLAPFYATGVFLLALLPSAVSSPAFTQLFGGALAPSFALVLLSTLFAPLLIPFAFAATGSTDNPHHIAAGPLFHTLGWCIFMPLLAWLALRRYRPVEGFFYRNNKLLSILLVAFVIALVIAKQRGLILADPIGLIVPLAISVSCYGLFLLFGWCCAFGAPRTERIAFATCSGFNNAALGVSLALLHFPPPVVLFVAVSEIGWSLLPLLLKGFLRLV